MFLHCVINKSPQHYTSFTQRLYSRLIASNKHNIAITHFYCLLVKLLLLFSRDEKNVEIINTPAILDFISDIPISPLIVATVAYFGAPSIFLPIPFSICCNLLISQSGIGVTDVP